MINISSEPLSPHGDDTSHDTQISSHEKEKLREYSFDLPRSSKAFWSGRELELDSFRLPLQRIYEHDEESEF